MKKAPFFKSFKNDQKKNTKNWAKSLEKRCWEGFLSPWNYPLFHEIQGKNSLESQKRMHFCLIQIFQKEPLEKKVFSSNPLPFESHPWTYKGKKSLAAVTWLLHWRDSVGLESMRYTNYIFFSSSRACTRPTVQNEHHFPKSRAYARDFKNTHWKMLDVEPLQTNRAHMRAIAEVHAKFAPSVEA